MVFDGRNREMLFLFWGFVRDFLEIANSGSVNGDAGLGFCKRFARNGATSNGIQGTPHKGVLVFD